MHCRRCCRHHCKTTAFPSRIPPPANGVGQQRAGRGADETFRGAITVVPQSQRCSGSIVLLHCASHGHSSHWWPSSFPRNRPFLANSRHHCPCPPPPAPKERQSRIVTLVQGGQHTTTTAGSIGGAIRATYDARSKSRACVRPSSPPSMLSSIFSPSES